MPNGPEDAGRSMFGWLVKIPLILFVITLVAWASVGRLAAWKRASVEAAWAASYGDWDAFVARHPARDVNDAAREVERLAAALGVEIKQRSDRPAPATPRADAERGFEEVRKPLLDWVADELSRPGPGVTPPPAEAAAFLERHAPDVAAVRAALRSGSPRWSLHLERGFRAEVPNLLGHLTLQRLLAADALAHLERGDRQTALATLDASWSLNAALRDDPVLITQLIAIAVTRLQLGVLRRVPDAPDEWLARLGEHDHRATLEEALRVEGVIWTRSPHVVDPEIAGHADGTDRGGSSPFDRVVSVVAAPYERFSSYEHAGRWLDDMRRLDGAPLSCGLGEEPFRFSDPPRWNLISTIVTPNMGSTVDRLAQLELELETTRRWLEVHAFRQRVGRWPDALPGGAESAACRGARFEYAAGEDGPRLSLDPRPEWPHQPGLVLPTVVRAAAPEPSGA